MRQDGVRAQQREQTRQALLREGRRLFSGRGYADVGLTEIVAAAGVTKGALYHHFAGKAELFRAVLEEAQQEVARRVEGAAAAHDDPWEQLVAGCQEFITAATDPEVRRVMLVDGPAVLGWTEWRAMDEAGSARHLADALTALVDAGVIVRQPVGPLVHLLSGAMNEAALWLASTARPEDLAPTRAALEHLLGALRTRPPR
ncbi:TetR/AcrR family transcriptional regulator [Streptomyces genisteinicus]|uniref:TetR/AcrR family transcriptional regulator n=1 Tax=Streptomyces genisteinicus TaxID=2768068 RepID=A0A7H0I044_9ACTN|nr:TetR/AcrR family transcriptional regulator [Streptomyces genisteinicus]QNP66160.1 TetR/AcrR family transcriptional regulator [Streptomyces genisteinicus]